MMAASLSPACAPAAAVAGGGAPAGGGSAGAAAAAASGGEDGGEPSNKPGPQALTAGAAGAPRCEVGLTHPAAGAAGAPPPRPLAPPPSGDEPARRPPPRRAPAAPTPSPGHLVASCASAADLASIDALAALLDGAAAPPRTCAASAPCSLGGSAASSECGDGKPLPGPPAPHRAAALSRLGPDGARRPPPPPRPDSAASFYAADGSVAIGAAPAAAGAKSAPPAAPVPPAAHDPAPAAVRFNWAARAAGGAARALADAALDTLAAAMAGDAVNAFFLGAAPGRKAPAPASAARFARKEIKGYLKALPAAAHFYATPDAAAVALWQLLPSETPRNELLAGWTRILRVPLRLWPALVALELRYEAAHAAQAAAAAAAGGAEGYYYLSFIGTAPAARGRGLASALISEVTARADAEGRPCLLEATSARAAALYARHGFEVYDTFRVTPAAPPVFFMRRPPQASAAPVLAPVAVPASAPLVKGPAAIASKALARAPSEAGSDDSGSLIPTAVITLAPEPARAVA
jgi:ribosomal protein S18 acetylase RimI-like enzyme